MQLHACGNCHMGGLGLWLPRSPIEFPPPRRVRWDAWQITRESRISGAGFLIGVYSQTVELARRISPLSNSVLQSAKGLFEAGEMRWVRYVNVDTDPGVLHPIRLSREATYPHHQDSLGVLDTIRRSNVRRVSRIQLVLILTSYSGCLLCRNTE